MAMAQALPPTAASREARTPARREPRSSCHEERQLPESNRKLFKTGDRLGREDFERRYALTPHVKEAGLIGGMVVMEEHIEGAPELVAEIAAGSFHYNLRPKRDAYARNGVLEYIVLRTLDREIDWFALVDGEFHPIPADQNGDPSHTFPGLALATAALVEGDFPTVKAALNDAMTTSARRAFVAKLHRQAVD